MTPHPLILAELQKYKGGKFVPKDVVSGANLEWQGRLYEYRLNGDHVTDIEDHHAHVHIELAAWKMVRKHAKSVGRNALADDLTNEIRIYAIDFRDKYELLGSGPTDADALLAALEKINAKEN